MGVEKAVATKQEDREVIFNEVRSQFGSVAVANEHLDQVLRERFSRDWYELRERDQDLGFRPWPFLYEQMEGGEEELRNRGPLKTDPYYGAGIRESRIYGSQKRAFDLLIESGVEVSAADVEDHQFRTSSEAEIDLVDAARKGDRARALELLNSAPPRTGRSALARHLRTPLVKGKQ